MSRCRSFDTILEENFLQDENGRWYIPDVTKEGDLVKLREKNCGGKNLKAT